MELLKSPNPVIRNVDTSPGRMEITRYWYARIAMSGLFQQLRAIKFLLIELQTGNGQAPLDQRNIVCTPSSAKTNSSKGLSRNSETGNTLVECDNLQVP